MRTSHKLQHSMRSDISMCTDLGPFGQGTQMRVDRGKLKQLQPRRPLLPYYAQNFVTARSPVSGQVETRQQPKSIFQHLKDGARSIFTWM